MHAFSTAFTTFRRSPLLSFLSVTTIAFSLFAFGLFALVALNISAALDEVEERVEIRAFIEKSTDMGQAASVASEISRYPEVLEVDMVTREMALERVRRELGEFRDVFESDFLPASLDIKLRPGYRNPDVVRNVAQRVREFSF